jgi:acetyl esterase/lipase
MKLHTLFVCALAAGAPLIAQETIAAERPLDADKVIPLYLGVAPGSENWAWKEQVSDPPWGGRGGRLVRNVVRPTLTVFQPPNSARSTRTAVIIAPGGGFQWLSIDSEGYDVARALAARGVTALVLKYRLQHTADEEATFKTESMAFLKSVMDASRAAGTDAKPKLPPMPRLENNPGPKDGIAALRYVREHATDLGVDPDRIGIVGFSAGGGVVNYTLTNYDAETRPNFAAQIYAGSAAETKWKADLPPVFLAVAADDFLIDGVLTMFQSLRSAKRPVEMHVFNAGGHGFGMQQRGLTCDLWIDEFAAWMASLGYLTPRN